MSVFQPSILPLLTTLNRIACLNPGVETTKDGGDFCISIIDQHQRRTGACFLGWSSSVGDDPCALVKLPHASW
jgi:hypothetical protein